jgi:ankyrin repeat protein
VNPTKFNKIIYNIKKSKKEGKKKKKKNIKMEATTKYDILKNPLFIESIKKDDMDYFSAVFKQKLNILTKNDLSRVFEYLINHGASRRIVEVVLEYVDIDAKFSNGQTPLLLAISNNQYDIVSLLLSKGANLRLTNNKDENPLIYVCKYSHFHDIMELLLKNNANFNKRDSNGRTAVMYAINTSNLKKLRLLLNHNYISNNVILKLILFGKHRVGTNRKQLRQIILNEGKKYQVSLTDKNGENALIYACKTRNENIIDIVLEYSLIKCKNVYDRRRAFETFESYYKLNILLWAVINNYKQIVELLFKNGYKKNITDEFGNSLLMHSVINNKKEMIELLMKYDADICECNRAGLSPLLKSLKFSENHICYLMNHANSSPSNPTVFNFYQAIWRNDLNFLYKCLKIRNRRQNEIDMELDDDECDIFTLNGCDFDCALALAVLSNHSLPQLLLINYYKKFLCKKYAPQERRQWYSLLYGAKKGNSAVVDFIFSLGSYIDVNIKNQFGDTPLMLACKYGHEAIASKLISRNAHLDKLNKDYDTAISLASANGFEKVVELLLCYNADMTRDNVNKKTALTLACENGHDKVVNLLLNYGRKRNLIEEREINSILLKASEYGFISIVETLLSDPGINVNVYDEERNTALHLASENGHMDIIKLLLEHQANTECKNCDLNTPLLIACDRGNEELVKLLLAHKANKNSRNRFGFTPFLIATKRRYTSIANILLYNLI